MVVNHLCISVVLELNELRFLGRSSSLLKGKVGHSYRDLKAIIVKDEKLMEAALVFCV